MRPLLFSLSIVATVFVSWANPALAQNVKAHKGAAERAIVKERWCEAVFLYAKLDDVDANPEWALQAAEAAQFADDRPRAVALFKSALARAPKHPRARAMEQSIAALEKLIGKSGNGSACGTPTPECGNGVLEGSETCDDGNRQSGDACPGTCSGTASRPAVVPPVLPPVKPPVIVPPVVVPPVVVPPVVVPPVVPPPKVTPPPPVVVAPPPEVAGPAKLCTLIKPVKIFIKGEWKTFEFGSTLTIKSTGPQWTMVETPQGDGGKIAASTMEGACAHPNIAPTAPVAETTPTTTPTTTTTPEPEVTEPEDTEPVVTEPVKEPEPVRETETIEPLRDEREPAAVAPEVEESGGGLGGWIMLGVGSALAIGGGTAAVWGSLPYFEYTGLCGAGFGATNCPALDALGQDYRGETDPDDRAQLADDATDLRGRVDNAAQAWDEGGNGGAIPTGRFVLGAGVGAAVLGVGLAVGGLIIALSGGDEATEETEESE